MKKLIYAYTPEELAYLQARYHLRYYDILMSPYIYTAEERELLETISPLSGILTRTFTLQEALCRSQRDWNNHSYDLYILHQNIDDSHFFYYVGTSSTPLTRLHQHLSQHAETNRPVGSFILQNLPHSLTTWHVTLLRHQTCIEFAQALYALDLQHWRAAAKQWRIDGRTNPDMWDDRYFRTIVVRSFPLPRPHLVISRFGIERALIRYLRPYLNIRQQHVPPTLIVYPLPASVTPPTDDPSWNPRLAHWRFLRLLHHARTRYRNRVFSLHAF